MGKVYKNCGKTYKAGALIYQFRGASAGGDKEIGKPMPYFNASVNKLYHKSNDDYIWH